VTTGGQGPAGRRRVLVVDDQPVNADSLAMVLELEGLEVETAYDGRAALEAAGRFRPHVVLLDIGMPKLDGYEVCRRLRAGPDGRRMTLIALTGWSRSDDLERAREAGFDHHLSKPVETDRLLRLLASIVTAGAPDP
jgi:CheY-like chemotaxis protein